MRRDFHDGRLARGIAFFRIRPLRATPPGWRCNWLGQWHNRRAIIGWGHAPVCVGVRCGSNRSAC